MQIEDRENQFENPPISFPEGGHFFVIVGGNNSGKSTVLRCITKTFGENAYLVDVNRTLLRGEGSQNKNYLNSFTSYVAQIRTSTDDNSEKQTQVLQDLFNLNDTEREQILEWYNQYFPSPIYEEQENPQNSASPVLLKVNGFPITKQGSGIRATLEVFVRLFDPKIKILCIDEPELGLEPYLQKYLFQALKDKSGEDKKIIIATHSHHFLDLEKSVNNFICKRNGEDKIELFQINNDEELKDVIFRLLGNTLSSFMLPERLLILGGVSDYAFVLRVLKLLSKNGYGIQSTEGDGNIKYAINSVTWFLKFNKTNLPVYKEKIWLLADKQIKNDVIVDWRNLLGDESRMKILSKNGIEYYYPERIVQKVFRSSLSKDEIIDSYLAHKPNRFNGIQIPKTKFATEVVSELRADDLSDANNELFNFLRNLP